MKHFLLGLKRRRVVHLKHSGILDLTLRKRDRFQAERGNLYRGRQRTRRGPPDRDEAQGDLTLGIEIKQAVHVGVYESEHNLGWQPRSYRNGQHIRQQRAVIPTEMAIGARLVLPGVSPVRSGAENSRGGMSHSRL